MVGTLGHKVSAQSLEGLKAKVSHGSCQVGLGANFNKNAGHQSERASLLVNIPCVLLYFLLEEISFVYMTPMGEDNWKLWIWFPMDPVLTSLC